MGSWLWWLKNVIIGVFSIFFLIFGIEVLIGAYALKHPQTFIMYFFSGSFIALVGLVGLFEGVEQLVRPPADHRDQEVGLGREVVVERALRDAGRLRDLLDRHGLVADVDAELQGGVHELVTPDRRVFGDACHGGLPSD